MVKIPRSGGGIYAKPAGTTPANGDLIEAPKYNTLMDDIAADLNIPRPIVAGGTGASSAATALSALGGAAKSANLSDLANLATARTNLGLVPQTTAVDTTAGRLLTVGAFGLGLTAATTTTADIDATTIPAGSSRYDNTTVGTFPAGVTAAAGGLFDLARTTANAAREMLMPSDQNAMFFRRLAGGVVQPWQSLVSVLASTIADGDTIARISGVWARVAKGAAGQVYRQNDALTAPVWSDPIQSQAAQVTTSGTNFDFTGIPAWAKRVTFSFNGISLSGTDNFLVQLGVAAGFVGAGYTGGSFVSTGGGGSYASSAAGMMMATNAAGESHTGQMTLTRMSTSNNWVSSHTLGTSARLVSGGGAISLAATLTQVRLTRDGANTFDAGSVSITYE